MLIKRILSPVKKDSLYKSMILSATYKPINMILTFVYTPILIAWLGEEKYGIWVTILSIINWINFFDVGIGNGLRNVISQEITKEEYKKTKRSVSTAYTIMFFISVGVSIIVIIMTLLLDWKLIFNTTIESRYVVLFSLFFVCINLFLSLQKSEYYAEQKAEIVSLQGTIIQFLNLFGIIIATRVSSGKLMVVALLFSMSSIVVNIYYSVRIWKQREYLRPSWRLFDKSQVSDITGLGIKFFLLQMAALVLFTTDNMIITILYGPELVTPYSTVNKVFLAYGTVFSAMISPLWSKFTVAKEMKDYSWMKKIVRKMNLLLIPVFMVIVITVIFFQPLSDIWLGRRLNYDKGLVLVMGVYIFSYIYSMIYATVMNGMGCVNLQLVVAIAAAIVNIPLSIFFAKSCMLGTTGICLATGLTSIIGNIIYTVYVNRIISQGGKVK